MSDTWTTGGVCFGETQGDRKAELHRAIARYFGPSHTGELTVVLRDGEVVEHTEITRLAAVHITANNEEEFRDA